MASSWRDAIHRIHAAQGRVVLAITGGGASAIGELLSLPGGSKTVLEAIVPYSASALGDWLGRRPDQFCSEDTALAMAAVAYQRALQLAEREQVPIEEALGLGATAALVSAAPKKGEHRCHVAIQSREWTRSWTLVLKKGARDRAGEELLACHLVLQAVASACGLQSGLPEWELLVPDEHVQHDEQQGNPLLVELVHRQRDVVWSLPDGSLQEALAAAPTGVLCGAYNPLHFGHEQLRAAAEQVLGGVVCYEMSIHNVDKPPLDYLTLSRRRRQFQAQPLALTRAPTFAEKARVLPGTTFVVGIDTAERILQPRYYQGGTAGVDEALATIERQGCRFLVAGRLQHEKFVTLQELPIPPRYAGLFSALPETSFRADISSTELRAQVQGPLS